MPETFGQRSSVALRTVPNIALLGKAGSGKDTAAELLAELYPYQRVAFADKLKDVATIIWGPGARTDRTKLQKLGVAVREIQENSWVEALLTGASVEEIDGEPRFVEGNDNLALAVTDCRFPNEASYLAARGFVTIRILAGRGLRVNRLRANGKLQDEAQLDHVSETALDNWTPDYNVVNATTLEALAEELVKVVEIERAKRG
jgi:hypothetical protein